MIQVVLDQGALGLSHRAFDRVELLRQIQAGAAFLNHGDHAAQMTPPRRRRFTMAGWVAWPVG